MDNSQVWFITGCSQGLGLVIAEHALEAGHRVVATARRVQSLAPLAAKYGDRVKPYQFDVDVWEDSAVVVDLVMQQFGRIDVLVNNAGYGLEGALEELTQAQIRRQMETNFFGLTACVQAVTPVMRAQGSGCIFNISSIAGMRGTRGMSLYNASKFAVTGLTEALAGELAPFGIRVACVEPGPYRTNWAGPSLHKSEAMTKQDPGSPYAEQNAWLAGIMSGHDGKQPGDPAQLAAVLVQAATLDKLPVHMIFGDEAIQIWQTKMERYQDPAFLSTYPHHKRTAV
ncbi:MAG: SDR family NAD(P)-dependent oxidoreductase [Bacteroidetes bacterium]|nr:SDR family NAD(P)-dependent oxidoreductase [Bacteroidota bacterium]